VTGLIVALVIVDHPGDVLFVGLEKSRNRAWEVGLRHATRSQELLPLQALISDPGSYVPQPFGQ
jgi:hypothetical protein